jgi:hypothetical protein
MPKKPSGKHADPVVEQLDQVKRLIMLQLLASGVEAQDIGKVLGVSKQRMSGIIPVRSLKALKKRST